MDTRHAIALLGQAALALQQARTLAPARAGQQRDLAAFLDLDAQRLEGQSDSGSLSDGGELARDAAAALAELHTSTRHAAGPGPRNYGSGVINLIKPDQIRDEVAIVDGEVARLDLDVQRSAAPAFKVSWGAFRDEWATFHAHNSDPGWLTGIGTYDQTLEYRGRVADWRKKFEAEASGAPSVSSSPTDRGAPKVERPIPWTSIAIGAGVLTAAAAGVAVWIHVKK